MYPSLSNKERTLKFLKQKFAKKLVEYQDFGAYQYNGKSYENADGLLDLWEEIDELEKTPAIVTIINAT